MGYDYLTLTDHVVLPDIGVPGYPVFRNAASSCRDAPTERHELLTATAFIAAKTSRIRLVLAVMVVPHRPAVLAAKMLSTIDVLSERAPGRRHRRRLAEGGVRCGGDHAVRRARRGDRRIPRGVPRAVDRGARPVRRPLHEVRRPDLPDRKPVQKPHPPIWVGGESGPSLRRAARFGDAWYPIGTNNRHLLDTLPRLAAGIARLRRLTAEAGRDPASVSVAYRVKRYGEAVPPMASDGERRLFSGSDADIVGDLRALRDLGVTAIDVEVEGHDEAATLANMRRFKETIFARV